MSPVTYSFPLIEYSVTDVLFLVLRLDMHFSLSTYCMGSSAYIMER